VLKEGKEKIRVRICFSSFSMKQKFFGSSGRLGEGGGRIWKSKEWETLGLPKEEEISGLEMTVKSIFVKPVSVLHPKFIVVDRRKVWFLSCNVSWEEWFEGVIGLEGEIVGKTLEYWRRVWGSGGDETLDSFEEQDSEVSSEGLHQEADGRRLINHITLSAKEEITTILLPSPHHSSLSALFSPSTNPPPTPLNLFLLTAFSSATRSIFITTPNLTSSPVIEALFTALKRGVDITILTSRKLMILEQLVTARTITEWEVWKLTRRYRKLLSPQNRNRSNPRDLESGARGIGVLKIGYFKPKGKKKREEEGEPVKLHFKCTVVDGEIAVLGSGNMDRASWWTSQELGVAVLGADVVREIERCAEEGLEGRIEWVC